MIACAILAAGASRRLGRAKQLVAIDGEPLVRRTARAAIASACGPVAVVVGAAASEVSAALEDLAVEIVPNDAWPEGIASSVRAAAAWAQRVGARALVLAVVDQRRLDATHLRALVDAFVASEAPDRIAASAYDGIAGVPAVFGAALFARLGALTGDEGARAIVRERRDVVVVAWPEGALDVDLPSDLP